MFARTATVKAIRRMLKPHPPVFELRCFPPGLGAGHTQIIDDITADRTGAFKRVCSTFRNSSRFQNVTLVK
jgi:hypothetical protein